MTRVTSACLAALLAGAAAASEVEVRHGEYALDHGNSDWRDTSLRLAVSPPAGSPRAEVIASRIERFGRVDSGFAATARAPLGRRCDVAMEGGASATHEVIPAWVAGGGAQCALGRGFAAYAGLRWSRYEGDVVATEAALGHVGVEVYRGPVRFAWTTFVSRVEGTFSSSQAAAADLFYRGRDRLGLVLSAGRELESLGAGRVLTTDVLAAAVLGRTALPHAWAVTYGVELERQGELYTRAGGRLGLAREF
jgi:YaiO family outer membrane protein